MAPGLAERPRRGLARLLPAPHLRPAQRQLPKRLLDQGRRLLLRNRRPDLPLTPATLRLWCGFRHSQSIFLSLACVFIPYDGAVLQTSSWRRRSAQPPPRPTAAASSGPRRTTTPLARSGTTSTPTVISRRTGPSPISSGEHTPLADGLSRWGVLLTPRALCCVVVQHAVLRRQRNRRPLQPDPIRRADGRGLTRGRQRLPRRALRGAGAPQPRGGQAVPLRRLFPRRPHPVRRCHLREL